MSETKYEVGLKMSVGELVTLLCSLDNRMMKRAEDGDSVTTEAMIYTQIEGHVEKLKLTEEQQELDRKIKDLEARRNELRS